jgi:hypothetical protein
MVVFRVIAAVVLVLLAVVVGTFFWSILSPAAGRLDAIASRRIHQTCGFNAECKVRIGDLYDGNWDTFYEFGEEVPQAQVTAILGSSMVAVRPHQRIVVMARDGHPMKVDYAKKTQVQPVDGEIEFESERHREQRAVRYPRTTWLQVSQYPVDSSGQQHGTYYVLSATSSP